MTNQELQKYVRAGFGGETYTRVINDATLASDAALVTSPNMGIPGELTTFFDPEVVNILTAVRRARALTNGNEVKKGDATTVTVKFPVLEYSGHTEPYSDFADGGTATINANWVARDNYLYQDVRGYGDLEEAKGAVAKVSVARETQQAAAYVFDVDSNKFYFYGVAGLRNYGILNDPSLSSPEAPTAGAGGSVLWSDKTTAEIYKDILDLFQTLVAKTGNLVTESDPLILAMSGSLAVLLATPNDLGISVLKMLNDYFSALTIVKAPEYTTEAGELMQFIAPRIDNVDTIQLCFSEKMYAFAPVRRTSSIVQKFRAGTYGAVIRRPAAIVSMIGM